MGKGTQKEATDPEKLLKVPGDAEKGAKQDYARDALCRNHSSSKAIAAVIVLCFIIIIIIITTALTTGLAVVSSRTLEFPLSEPCCPDDWVGYRGKCYYFSEAEGTWDSSQNHCSSLNASLAEIDTLQDLAFLLRYKGSVYHWIGLWREEGQPWKWVNGTEFNSMFEVRGGGTCAYLNDVAVNPSRCQTEKKWVCSKPSGHLRRKKNGMEQKGP
ncbi:C-type lectin domain family 2 member B-like [Emydura macquarii macquarii]|uniref:C-type lectin domain family 2 member B-like n=1 Tax=Emydura macquarii macquarii TaxID=1129001 RepID=UPI00352A0507